MSKLRKFVDSRTALLIYKQAILPIVEYAGFVLISCSQGQRYYWLWVLQNNALRICKKYFDFDHGSRTVQREDTTYTRICKMYNRLDMIHLCNLHEECSILGLELRRRKQLLRLMYLHSKNDANIKDPARQTRTGNNIVFKTATKCNGKYLNSPFYKGTLLWNKLDANI